MAYLNMYATTSTPPDPSGPPDPLNPPTPYRDDAGGFFFVKGEVRNGVVMQPQAGDLIYFIWNGSGHNHASHIGIVYDTTSTTIKTIEGNAESPSGERGAVYKKEWLKSEPQIKGYFRPNFN